MENILSDYLSVVQQRKLYRHTVTYTPVDAAHVQYDGREYLMLAANNYLGLTHCPLVQQAAREAIAAYGTGSGGARLTTGTHPLFDELEEELASFKGTEAALIFNSGYMANIGVISSLAGPQDVIFSDELNHASIIDGCRLSRATIAVYRHCDMDHLKELLKHTACSGYRLIVTDGVFSMDGDIAPLDKIAQLAAEFNAIIIVDDAHATGVIGTGGKGTAAYFGLEGKIQVQIGTLSKAFGSEGGYVAGSRLLIDYITNKARSFIFSTAMAPGTAAAGLAALKQVKAKPELVNQLWANAEFMRSQLTQEGLIIVDGITPIIPVMVGDVAKTVALAEVIREAGIIATAIRPPTVPQGTSRLRLTVSAVHGRNELHGAAKTIAALAKRLGIV